MYTIELEVAWGLEYINMLSSTDHLTHDQQRYWRLISRLQQYFPQFFLTKALHDVAVDQAAPHEVAQNLLVHLGGWCCGLNYAVVIRVKVLGIKQLDVHNSKNNDK